VRDILAHVTTWEAENGFDHLILTRSLFLVPSCVW
jgi:hypothetical protein